MSEANVQGAGASIGSEVNGKVLTLDSSNSWVVIRVMRIERTRTERWEYERAETCVSVPRKHKYLKKKAEENEPKSETKE